MLADSIDAREVDLSHLQFLIISPPVIESIRGKLPLRYLLAGIAISIFCHALLLLFNWELHASPPVNPPATKLMIRLQQAAIPDIKPLSAAPETIETPSVADIPAKPIADALQTQEQLVNPLPINVETLPPAVVIQPLTSEELRSVIEVDDQPRTQSRGSGISANVFNPALRKRLQVEESKPVLVREDMGLKNHIDPSGATIVDLGEGECLRSSVVTKPGEAQNWYKTMTPCGGTTESERAMDRVNQEVRERFQQ